MLVTFEQLNKVLIYAPDSRINLFLEPFNKTLEEFEINTPLRICHFLAQVAHESGEFRYVEEIASGKAYDTGRLASRLGNTPEADGDGQRYKGRGLIQVTGRTNYAVCGKALGLDLISDPELLEQPIHACRSAGWYWDSRKLNDWADEDDILIITKKINGGYNGLHDREKYLTLAKRVIL